MRISIGHLGTVDTPEHAQSRSRGHRARAGLPNVIERFLSFSPNTIQPGERGDRGERQESSSGCQSDQVGRSMTCCFMAPWRPSRSRFIWPLWPRAQPVQRSAHKLPLERPGVLFILPGHTQRLSSTHTDILSSSTW